MKTFILALLLLVTMPAYLGAQALFVGGYYIQHFDSGESLTSQITSVVRLDTVGKKIHLNFGQTKSVEVITHSEKPSMSGMMDNQVTGAAYWSFFTDSTGKIVEVRRIAREYTESWFFRKSDYELALKLYVQK